jgi:putative hydroxymethylpyrimidine transport system permease protein
MLLANGRAKIDLMFAALIVLACMTVMLHLAVGRLADRLSRYANGEL